MEDGKSANCALKTASKCAQSTYVQRCSLQHEGKMKWIALASYRIEECFSMNTIACSLSCMSQCMSVPSADRLSCLCDTCIKLTSYHNSHLEECRRDSLLRGGITKWASVEQLNFCWSRHWGCICYDELLNTGPLHDQQSPYGGSNWSTTTTLSLLPTKAKLETVHDLSCSLSIASTTRILTLAVPP